MGNRSSVGSTSGGVCPALAYGRTVSGILALIGAGARTWMAFSAGDLGKFTSTLIQTDTFDGNQLTTSRETDIQTAFIVGHGSEVICYCVYSAERVRKERDWNGVCSVLQWSTAICIWT